MHAGSVHRHRDDRRRRRRVPIVGVDELVGAHAGRRLPPPTGGSSPPSTPSSQAVRAAVELQRSPTADGPGAAPRIGVAAGDVTWQGEECFGTPVVTAERLRAAAGSGQIVVTGPVRVLAGDRVGVGYEPLGWLALADVDEAVESWVVGWDRSATDAAPSAPPPMRAGAGRIGGSAVRRPQRRAGRPVDGVDRRGGRHRPHRPDRRRGRHRARPAWRPSWPVASTPPGAAVLYGACDDDLALPYQPWVQALDPVVPALVAARPAAGGRPRRRWSPLLRSAERFVA